MKQLEFEFMQEYEEADKAREAARTIIDEEMDKLFKDNDHRFQEIMDYYRIPHITRNEIRTLCRWS